MVALTRRSLPQTAADYLARQTERLASEDSARRRELGNALWEGKSRARFAEIREVLLAMCSGVERCMYCEDSAGTDIDHYRPRSESPLGAFEWSNYLAACSTCNSNYKRDQFPRSDTGSPLLIDPTAEDPRMHIVLGPRTGRYSPVPASEKASPSIRVFGLNRSALEEARRNAWVLLEVTVAAYARAQSDGDVSRADRIAYAASRQPFAGVLRALLDACASAEGELLVHEEARLAVAEHPEISQWLP